MTIWAAVFWGSAALLGWAYAGYPLALSLLAGRRRNQEAGHSGGGFSVSVVIAAKNESVRIAEKIRGLLKQGGESLGEIVVVCDHCEDDTAAQAEAAGGSRVRCIRHDTGRPGKAGALNAGVAAAASDLVLFNDVRQSLADDAIERLAAWFRDPRTGAVSGSLEISSSAGGAGRGLDAYWSLEKRIREGESVLDSSIGCTGAVYMIRRELYVPVPPDTILDDVVIPMLIAEQGFRVRFDPAARAFDPQPLAGEAERRRKIRTAAGNFQMLFRHPRWLLPWRSRLWSQLISHKYLRSASPLLLAACLASAFMLRGSWFYLAVLAAGLALGLLAGIGLAAPSLKSRLFAMPAGFAFLQIAQAAGFWMWLRSLGGGQKGWR